MQGAQLVVAALRRKGAALAKRPNRWWRRLSARDDDYARRPPVLVTTVPKSGTHLVHQIVSALPATVDHGTFIARTPSFRRRPRSTRALLRRVRAIAPGEIVRAHLDHEAEIVTALRRKHAFVVFVYRDPRDVVVSEAHYLSDRAPWHALHREFSTRDPSARIDLAIAGLSSGRLTYEDVGRRFARFAGWLDDAHVALRFEDLVNADTVHRVVANLVSRYGEAAAIDLDTQQVTADAIEAIDPSRSHTFREGRVGAWRTELSDEQKSAVTAVAKRELERFAYPAT